MGKKTSLAYCLVDKTSWLPSLLPLEKNMKMKTKAFKWFTLVTFFSFCDRIPKKNSSQNGWDKVLRAQE